MIATVITTATTTVTDTLESLFAELDLHLAGAVAAETDLVIDELDQWRNPEGALARLCEICTNVVVPAQREMTRR